MHYQTMYRKRYALAGAIALMSAGLMFFCPTGEPFAGWDPWRMDVDMLLAWVLVSLTSAGIFLLCRALLDEPKERTDARPRQVLPGIVLRKLPPLPRHRHVPLMIGLPNYGIYWGLIPFVLTLFFCLPKRVPVGLMIHVPQRYVASLPHAPESESLGVYVGAHGQFYVNGQLVPREKLKARLRDELAGRSLWIVYFEADDDVAYGQVVFAIDTIRGLGAQAYWITPSVREEFTNR